MQLQLTQFTGPLDLLLSLVEEKELNITEIALAEVTEQYLAHLDTLEEREAVELADFLVIAAKLLYLKSKRLLPEFLPEEEEDADSLEAQLRLYKQFVQVSRHIESSWLDSTKSVFRKEPPRAPAAFALPPSLSASALRASMVHLIKKIAPPKALPRTHIDKGVSLKERIDRIRTLLKSKEKMRFSEAIDNAENKTEIIIGFLALLELVKQQSVSLEQDSTFGDILISRI